MARIVARATCCADRVPTQRGRVTPLSANIPASRMNPGRMTLTPTPVPAKSWRRPREKPRTPNFVAL